MIAIRLLLFTLCWLSSTAHLAAQVGQHPYTTTLIVPETNGLKLDLRVIAAQRTQSEARILLLVHGAGPGGAASFDFGQGSFADSLACRGFIVYLMNVRGWEGSTAPNYDTHDTSLTAGSCVEAAADVDAAIDYIRQKEHVSKVSLFGWATGGHWVSYYTTRHNDKVDHLIVLNSLYGVKGTWNIGNDFADPADSNRYNSNIPVYRVAGKKEIIASRLAAIPFADKTSWVDTTDLEAYSGWVANDSNNTTLRVPGGYRRESFYMAHGHQYWNARDIRVPTLIVRSQYDFWSRPVDVKAYYNDLTSAPQREVLELPNATHFVTLDKPAMGRNALVAALDRFIPLPPPGDFCIDSIRSADQALDLIGRLDGYYYSELCIEPPKSPLAGKADVSWRRQFGATTWEKGDFDGNGRPDLLFNGYDYLSGNPYANPVSLVVLDLGGDSFRIIPLSNYATEAFFAAKKIRLDNRDQIVTLQYKKAYGFLASKPTRIDTLRFEYGYFIERIRHPHVHSIQKLSVCIDGDGRFDPGYSLIVHNDSIRLFVGGVPDSMGIFDSGSIFVARLDTADVNKLYSLLKDIDLPSLRSQYSVFASDLSSAMVAVHYDHGKTKTIRDLGEIGTYSLAMLYDLMKSFRNRLHWTFVGHTDRYSDVCD